MAKKAKRVRVKGRLLTARQTREREERIHRNALQRREAALNDPARVTQPLTPRLLSQELQGAERSQFGGEEQALRGQIGVSDQMSRNIPAWFQDYQNQIQHATAQQQGFFQGAAAAQQQLLGQLQQTSQTQNAQLAQQEQASAAQRGAQVDPSLARTAQQAADARAASMAGQVGLTQTLGANAGAFMGGVGVSAAQQRVSAQTDEFNTRRNLGREEQDLQRRKGDFRTAFRRQAREDERRFQLEQQAFGLNVAKAQDDARADRSRARDRKTDNERAAADTQRQARKDARDQNMSDAEFIAKYGITPAEARRGVPPTRGPGTKDQSDKIGGGGKSSITSTQRRNAKTKFRRAQSLARSIGVRRGEGQDTVNFLVDKKGFDPLLARAAVMTALYGGVDAKTRRRVHREYGIYLRLSRNKPRSQQDAVKNVRVPVN